MALNDKNAALNGIKVTMSTNTGVISAETVTTNTTTPATVLFSSPGNTTNRTATITATAGGVTSQIPIQIVGSTVTLEASNTSIPNDGITNVTLTVVAKDAGNNVVPNAAVTLTQAGAGIVNIAQATGTTDATGTFKTTIQGATAGAVTLTAAALGATASNTITVTNPGGNFAITTPVNPTTAMIIGEELKFEVNAPNGGTVTFAASIGTWKENGTSSYTAPVVAGKATATLTTTVSGVSNVAVYDILNNKDTRIVAMSSGAPPYRIIIQAAPANVPVSVGSTTGSSTLTATVYDNATPTPNPVGGVQVMFSIINPTSGGETVSPVVATTATDTTGGLSLGQARATFTSGSTPSGANGIQIRASVIGWNVQTGTAPSGNDAKIVMGGVAGSIAFGQATKIATINDATYSWPMSVLVADSSGGAVEGAEVSLSVWPIGWSTGGPCSIDADDGISKGTFWNEDRNENLFLDSTPAPQEDGYRKYYATNTFATTPGTQDTYITPVNSASGTVPSKVVTDANGVAAFKLNYPKQSAIWTVVRLRAATKVMGSETRAELTFRLQALEDDVVPNCLLGSSPYKF